MKDNYLIFGAPNIQQEEIDEVVDSLKSGWLGTGPKVARFEKEFAQYIGIPHAMAVNSCTAALHLSLVAAGLTQGDEVITTAMTFCATVNAIIHAGSTPVLVDINPRTLNIDVSKIEEKITSKTKAIVIVHFAGLPCDMNPILELVKKYNLILIEDCAHAIETLYQGRHVGTFGAFGCFSFYVTKNLVTGEGGMIVSNRDKDVSVLKQLGLHGLSKDAWKRFTDDGYKHYEVVTAGFKYNMMDMQAAIGIHQLSRIEKSWLQRSAIWRYYVDQFKDLPIGLPPEVQRPGDRHAYHLFTIRVKSEKVGMSRDTLLSKLHENGIGCGVHYLAMPEHRYYRDTFGWRLEDYPEARAYGEETISLPLSPQLTDSDIQRVVKTVRDLIV